jgi:hypothetical protein
MEDVRIDDEGNFRCWKCGGKNFDDERTFRSKAALGVGALLTHKKLKCQSCGEYNDTGSAKPFTGSAIEKKAEASPPASNPLQGWKKGWAAGQAKNAARATGKAAEQTSAPATSAPVAATPPVSSIADELAKLAALKDSGVLSAEEFDTQKAKLLGMA